MRSLIIAIQFLTRIPVPIIGDISEREVGRSLLYYPLVGLLIGLLLYALNGMLANAGESLQAALVLAAWVLITGALHLDGLADSVDAWLGGYGDRARTLEIMKDPRSGPAAIVLIVLLLLIKFAALEAIIVDDNGWLLILAPLLARTALPVLFQTTPYVRAGGLGSAMSEYVSSLEGILLPLLISFAVIILMGWSGLWIIIAVMISFMLLRGMMIKRLEGTTGDTAGALLEVIEAVVLVVAVLVK